VHYLLLVLLLADALLLMVVVLLQAGKGGGLAAMGAAGAGSDTLFGSRQAATLLTRATWWTGGIFLTLSFAISMLSGAGAQSESILRTGVQPTPATTAPVLPGTFETPPPSEPSGAAEPSPGDAPPVQAPQGQ
jgi:preprotein translocase subunit SecG